VATPAPPVPPAPAAPPRSNFYGGFSFGTGQGSVTTNGTTTAVNDLVPGSSPTTLALMLRGGWVSGDLRYGMQLNLVRSQWSSGGATSAMQLTGFDLVMTWMPRDGGVYLRLGLGPAKLSFEGSGSTSESYGGMEAMLGLGLSSGGFGVGIDYIRQTYDNGAPIDGAAYFLAVLSLDLD
jgi:hypothetical protein